MFNFKLSEIEVEMLTWSTVSSSQEKTVLMSVPSVPLVPRQIPGAGWWLLTLFLPPTLRPLLEIGKSKC